MLTGIPFLVVIVLSLAILAIIQCFLAFQHDRVVSNSGPLEEDRAIAARIKENRNRLADMEHDLQKCREALADVADRQAEVDSLERRRDELLNEWNQQEQRRNEVQALRRELEEEQINKLSLYAELANIKAEYEEARDRHAHAERLCEQVPELEKKYDAISRRIEELKPELLRLEEAEERLVRLEKRDEALRSSVAQIEGTVASRQSQLTELEQTLCSKRDAVEKTREELTRVETEKTATSIERKSLQTDIVRMEETRAALEARNAVLEGKISATAANAEEGDPLRELKVPPPVVEILKDWPESSITNENEALESVRTNFRKAGLSYPDRTLYAFHTAMKANESTQMTVLAGISGTGKSQLPRQYAAAMGIGFLSVPVQPRWDSPQDLMGFYNYVESRFRPTDMARALWAMDELNNPNDALGDRMLMILLDEMNLARVEYYFSDFLSRLESRPNPSEVKEKERRKDAEIELEIPTPDGKKHLLFPGYNLLFAGTMNEDESTQALSDKVMDRANIIRFASPQKIISSADNKQPESIKALKRSTWEEWAKPRSDAQKRKIVQEKIEAMAGIMKDLGRPFGHRLGRAMLSYVERYPMTPSGLDIINTAIADQVEMRLLPKLRGIEVEAHEQKIDKLCKFVDQCGDDPLAAAIKGSLEAAKESGQFVWLGVSRE